MQAALTEVFDYKLRRVIAEKISETIKLNMSSMTLPEWGATIAGEVKSQLNGRISSFAVTEAKRITDELLTGDFKKDWKLSEIIKAMLAAKEMQDVDDNDIELADHSYSLIIGEDRSILTHIYLDPEPGKERYQCKYNMSLLETGEINSVIGEGRPDRFTLGSRYGMERLFFRLYANKCKIDLDIEG